MRNQTFKTALNICNTLPSKARKQAANTARTNRSKLTAKNNERGAMLEIPYLQARGVCMGRKKTSWEERRPPVRHQQAQQTPASPNRPKQTQQARASPTDPSKPNRPKQTQQTQASTTDQSKPNRPRIWNHLNSLSTTIENTLTSFHKKIGGPSTSLKQGMVGNP